MKRPTTERAENKMTRKVGAPSSFGGEVRSLFFFLFASLIVLSACGGSSSNSNQPQSSGQFAGNWQFSLSPPTDGSIQGSPNSACATSNSSPLCFGGFLLLQNDGAVSGALTYSIFLPAQSGGLPQLCNSGSAPVTGSVDGQNVSLTATAGAQTFTLTGTLSSTGTTMTGTYNSTAAKGCGTAQTGVPWSATSVPALTGAIQGNFHSVHNSALRNQVFPVTGTLTQGNNIGASNATITGTLNFQGYPCLSTASVNGQVSGSSVILQIIASNGLNVGQIGAPAGVSNPSPVTVLSSASGTVLQGASGYDVTASSCPSGSDIGDVCLGVGNTTSCTQPILFSPASLTFPAQQVGSAPSAQTIILTNNNLSGTPLTGLTLSLSIINPQPGVTSPFGASDFNGLPSFTEQDNCATSPGTPFSLNPQQSCLVTVSFSPQQSCAWLPSTTLGGEAPSSCPFPLQASLTVTSPSSADSNTSFSIPITGAGFSAIAPSTPELDFGAEAVGEKSAPQQLQFTNQGANPVQILPALNPPCMTPSTVALSLSRPLAAGVISGLQVDTGTFLANPGNSTISYSCDVDPVSKQPNFQISADGCSGTLLMPQTSCSLEITFVPQPDTPLVSGLDYFLELNTLQCTSSVTSNCEIDSGRFPVELKANLPSPLRMTPAAGINFGALPAGQTSSPVTVTLFNDPKDPNAGTINFTGNILQSTNFAETDNCVGSLAPGASCTLTITSTPHGIGFEAGTITIGYSPLKTQTIYLRGTGR